MIWQFFANTFNLESKLTQTGTGLVKPGFLTREYLATRRVNYLSPIRVFIVLMFLMFFILSLSGIDFLSFNSQDFNNGMEKVKQRQLNRDNILQTLSVDNYINQQLNKVSELILQRDQSQEVIEQANQLIKDLQDLLQLQLDKTFSTTFFGERYEILRRDIYQLNADEIIEKYQITSLLDQLTFRAMLRFTQDPRGFLKFLFGNMTWAFFLDVLLMAGIFKLFYPKTRYVVHFVYHLHIRSFIFLIIMLGTGLYWLLPSSWTVAFLALTILTYIAISLHRVYQKKIIKTSLYFIVFVPLAMISFFIITFVVMFISSIMF
ncbi:MAG: DUF3667 domain-containing protein [Proteobacteria bacterium]|nr:MAG: DUF3667 domain-containing protein [Pseudomonadota bacterium]